MGVILTILHDIFNSVDSNQTICLTGLTKELKSDMMEE